MIITDMITQDLLDILSTSPHYFCRTWIRARKYRKIKALPSHIHVINDTQTSTGPFWKYVGWNKPSKPHTDGVIKLQKRTGQDGTFFLLFYAADHQHNINSKTKKKNSLASRESSLARSYPGSWIPCQWNLDSGFQSIAGVRIPQVKIWDHYAFLGNCPPTSPLSQHFALSEEWMSMLA